MHPVIDCDAVRGWATSQNGDEQRRITDGNLARTNTYPASSHSHAAARPRRRELVERRAPAWPGDGARSRLDAAAGLGPAGRFGPSPVAAALMPVAGGWLSVLCLFGAGPGAGELALRDRLLPPVLDPPAGASPCPPACGPPVGALPLPPADLPLLPPAGALLLSPARGSPTRDPSPRRSLCLRSGAGAASGSCFTST